MIVKRAIHWQLVWFSLLAILHGGAYVGVITQPNRRLPAGLAELPTWVLAGLAAGWLLAGLTGVLAATVVRDRHSHARFLISIMFGFWAGAYIYGWLWGGNNSGWIAAGLYSLVGLAVVTPPVWTVTIKSKVGP